MIASRRLGVVYPPAHQLHAPFSGSRLQTISASNKEGFAGLGNFAEAKEEHQSQIADFLEGSDSAANANSFFARNKTGRLSPAITAIPSFTIFFRPLDIAPRIQQAEQIERHALNSRFCKTDVPAYRAPRVNVHFWSNVEPSLTHKRQTYWLTICTSPPC